MSILGDDPILAGVRSGGILGRPVADDPPMQVPDHIYGMQDTGGRWGWEFDGALLWTSSLPQCRSLAVNPLTGELFVGLTSNRLRKIRASDGGTEWTYNGDEISTTAVGCGAHKSGHSVVLFAANSAGVVRLDENGEEVWRRDNYSDTAHDLAIRQDGRIVMTGRFEIQVRSFDTGAVLHEDDESVFAELSGPVTIDPEGYVYAGDRFTSGQVWKLSPDLSSIEWTYTGHEGAIQAVEIDQSGHVYIASGDDTVSKVNAENGSEIWRVDLESNAVLSVAPFPGGDVWVSTESGTRLRLLNGADGSVLDTNNQADRRLEEIETRYGQYGAFPEQWGAA